MAEIINMPRLSDTMEEGTVAKWFKKVGDQINEGDVLCIIEAMKMMNEVKSEFSGTVKQILVDNAEPVEFDQTLFVIS